MSVHYEWVGVEDCPINIVPGNFNVDDWGVVEDDAEDIDSERTTEGPSIIIGNDGGGIVITGERRDQLVEFARTLLRMTEDDERANQYAEIVDGIEAENERIAAKYADE